MLTKVGYYVEKTIKYNLSPVVDITKKYKYGQDNDGTYYRENIMINMC